VHLDLTSFSESVGWSSGRPVEIFGDLLGGLWHVSVAPAVDVLM